MKKVLISSLALLLILTLGTVLFRRNLAEFAIARFVKWKFDRSLSFKVLEISSTELKLSSLRFEDFTEVEELSLQFSGLWKQNLKLRALSLKASHMDLGLFLKEFESGPDVGESSLDEDSTLPADIIKDYQNQLIDFCEYKDFPVLNAEIGKIRWKGKEQDLGFRMESSNLDLGYMVTFRHSGSIKSDSFGFSLKGFFKLDCRLASDSAEPLEKQPRKGSHLQVKLEGGVHDFEYSDMVFDEILFSLNLMAPLEVGLPLVAETSLKVKGLNEGEKFEVQTDRLRVTATSGVSKDGLSPVGWLGKADFEKLMIFFRERIEIKSLKSDWTYVLPGHPSSPSTGLSIRSVVKMDSPVGYGEFSIKRSRDKAPFLVTVEKLEIDLAKNRSFFKRFPILVEDFNLNSGSIHSRGQIVAQSPYSAKTRFELSSVVRNLDFTFGENRLGPATINFKTTGQGKEIEKWEGQVKIDKVVGPLSAKEVATDFSLYNLNQLKVSQFVGELFGARINARDFEYDVAQKKLLPQKVKVSDLSLERLLSLVYDDSVKAKGVLDGEINVQTKNGKLIFDKSELHSRSKGWVKIRPPGSRPPDPTEIPVNPKSILDNYLYNFKYDDLSVELYSDESYRLYMTLRAFGRNPQYLDGKPLKLSLNLEMNALKALESYFLTMGFSDRLQEHLIKAGK